MNHCKRIARWTFCTSPAIVSCAGDSRRRETNPRPSQTEVSETKRLTTPEMEAAGIAPASQIPQVVSPHDTCVNEGCQWSHYVCTDAALLDLVANWHRLTPSVRTAILDLAQGC